MPFWSQNLHILPGPICKSHAFGLVESDFKPEDILYRQHYLLGLTFPKKTLQTSSYTESDCSCSILSCSHAECCCSKTCVVLIMPSEAFVVYVAYS